MTATTDPGPTTGPERGWTGPEPRPTPFERLRSWRPWAPPALVGGVVALGTAYVAWQDPNRSGGLFPGCPLKEATGFDCPGCGGTRAVHALTHGDIGTALDHNVVLTILLPLLAVAWGIWMVNAVRRSRAGDADLAPPWSARLRARLPRMPQHGWLAVIALIIAFGVIRNISAVPFFDYLASEA